MKTVNNIDAPSKARTLHSEQSRRREDFSLELAKVSDSQHEDQHAPHAADLLHEPAHVTMPSQKVVTTPPISPPATLATSNVMKVVLTDHSLPPQTTTSQNETRLELGLLPTIHTTPATPTAQLGLPPSVSIKADTKSSYETADALPDVAQAASAAETQEGDSQSWLSTQQQLNVMVAPTGVTEDLLGSRVFGVHLLASTYLSELAAREEGGITADSIPGALVPSDGHMPVIAQPVTPDATSTLSEAAADQVSRNEANIILNVIMNEEMAPAGDNTHPTRATAMATSSAATLVWSESLLRLTKGGDGSTVVWLRDYRMDGDEASRLVSALVQGAQAQGTRLGRIVLNGREVWTSPNNR